MIKKILVGVLLTLVASFIMSSTGYAYEETDVKDGGQIIGR